MRTKHFICKTVISIMALTPLAALSATHNVHSPNDLKNIMSTVLSGDTIVIHGGTYGLPSGKVNTATHSQANGGDPKSVWSRYALVGKSNVTIRGASASNRPVLTGDGYSGDVIFYIKDANGLTIKDIVFKDGKKGVLIDRSDGVTVDNARFESIGEEALHYRDGSDNGETKNSEFYKIGLRKKTIGEALYIGSDMERWHPDHTNNPSKPDRYLGSNDNHHIHNNVFEGEIGAEHIDIKEGTRNHNIHDNVFNAKHTDPTLSAAEGDWPTSVINDKGYSVRIHNNTFDFNGIQAPASDNRLAAIRAQQQLTNGEDGADLYGHQGRYVKNKLINASTDNWIVRAPGYGTNGTLVGCDTINSNLNKYRVTSSNAGLQITGNNGNTGASVISGNSCNNHTSGANGGSSSPAGADFANPIVYFENVDSGHHAEDTGIHAGSTQPGSSSSVQKWQSVSTSNGYVKLLNQASGWALHDRFIAADALVYIDNGSHDQQWLFETFGSGFKIKNRRSGRYLKDNGVKNAITEAFQSSNNFKWEWVGSGTHRQLRNVATNNYLEDTLKNDVKTRVDWQYNNEEKWEKIDMGSYFMFKNVGNGLCMHERYVAADVITNACNSNSLDQRWTIQSLGSGQYKIVNVRSGRVLREDVSKLDIVTKDTYTGANDQKWRLVTP